MQTEKTGSGVSALTTVRFDNRDMCDVSGGRATAEAILGAQLVIIDGTATT